MKFLFSLWRHINPKRYPIKVGQKHYYIYGECNTTICRIPTQVVCEYVFYKNWSDLLNDWLDWKEEECVEAKWFRTFYKPK